MILAIFERRKRTIAFVFLFLIYAETVLGAARQLQQVSSLHVESVPATKIPALAATLIESPFKGEAEQPLLANKVVETFDDGGPTQPEMQQFSSVNSSDMVDLFTGDFSYNIPLLDVGGYPVNISYRGGISMDQEASWVGLGWNINPGTITRNLRGVPDDFNGNTDTVTKTVAIKENETIGVTAGADVELKGYRLPVRAGASLGVFHNNYKGWGMELGLNASVNAGSKAGGFLSGGLSVTDNSQDGLTLAPNFSATVQSKETAKTGGYGSLTIGSSYNSRAGLSGLQLSGGLRLYTTTKGNPMREGSGGRKIEISKKFSSNLSFAYPSFTPSITMPFTSKQFSFTAKAGTSHWTLSPNFFISGYVSKQRIEERDQTLSLPAYGYLNYQNGNNDISSLLDFNREKDIPYRDKPSVPHIAVPSYTYDVFSITGEGTGGAFRAYRGDIGYVRDNQMRTRDESDRFSADYGYGTIVHAGVDLNVNRAVTQTGPWKDHPLASALAFRSSSKDFEAAYFRNPGEMAVNAKEFYQAIGGDDVVVPELHQSSSWISTTGRLNKYNRQKLNGSIEMNAANVVKPKRDKRSQVISYLTAEEAERVGLSKYIENRKLNAFKLSGTCTTSREDYDQGDGNGLLGKYFNNRDLAGQPVKVVEGENINRTTIGTGSPYPEVSNNDFSAQWTGRIKAPVTGTYYFRTKSDDGVRLWINDLLVIDDWNWHSADQFKGGDIPINMIAGEVNNIRVEYFEGRNYAYYELQWKYPGQDWQVIPVKHLYHRPLAEIFPVGMPEVMTREKRVNSYRKKSHISEINVLNPDGRRYVYGIPVYNLKQREATFSVEKNNGNPETGLVKFVPGTDNTTGNTKGRDNYFTAEDLPSYAHSFLLTGIVSSDYEDLTSNGISDDDPGDAIKFNYTRTAGITNPLEWRIPFAKDSVTYNAGLRTDNRDDQGNYMCGTREHWYLHTIESKNMVAAFFLDNTDRLDGIEMDEDGIKKTSSKVRRLRKISVYNKASFLESDTAAIPIKTVYFEYSYELCKGFNSPLNDSGKLTLKKIWFSYNGNERGKKNAYSFTYHANNPSYNIKSYDRWGNYKSPANNPSTAETISNADYPYVVQDSAQAAVNVAAWSLTQVKLPSGGIIKADYESDDYAYVQNKRAMQMCKLAGLGVTADWGARQPGLYTNYPGMGRHDDHLYAFIKVPVPVTSEAEIKSKYLDGIEKLYFRLYVNVPEDKWGSGYEYVPCYADIDEAAGYGYSGDMIRVKLKGIHRDGTLGGGYSPLAKAAVQFLRLNLPSKVYQGSEVGDNLNAVDAVKILFTMFTNVVEIMQSFDEYARGKGWGKNIDLNRSLVRLTCPTYNRLGGGSRVKRITVYDSWYKMTQQKEATYGQEYRYTTTREVDGKQIRISSGVAGYEPGIGGEENPFHLPIEYTQRVAPLAPVSLGYTEEPLGEGFFPSPSVGYSKVRVRSIHADKKRSANGYQETCFYTAYDFPTKVEWSLIDDNTRKRYNPKLDRLLNIDTRNFLTVAQGFKVELNDMHGKMRSTATYAENDPDNYVTSGEYFYRVEDQNATHKQLTNTVMAIDPDGTIDPAALIGKDAELMVDMRQQQTVVNGVNVEVNVDVVPAPPPIVAFPIISAPFMMQRAETMFRSTAAMKVIQRYGLIDSVVQIDKGSRVTVRNLLYDSETGDVLLTSTQNEFKDPVYNFTYPAHWAYDKLGMAYKNIDVTLKNLTVINGKITGGLNAGEDLGYLAGGDELLVYTKRKTGGADCNPDIATFPGYTRLRVADTSIYGGASELYLIDADGHVFSGHDVTLKVFRSGRKNSGGAVGSVSLLSNPLVKVGGEYTLKIDSSMNVLSAAAAEYKQVWRVADIKKQGEVLVDFCDMCCMKPFIDALLYRRNLSASPHIIPRVTQAMNLTIRDIVNEVNYSSYFSKLPKIDTVNCSFFRDQMDAPFYWIPANGESTPPGVDSGQVYFRFRLGDYIIRIIENTSSNSVSLYSNLKAKGNCPTNKMELYASSDTPFMDSCYTYTVAIDLSKTSCNIYLNDNCDMSVSTIPVPMDNPVFTFNTIYNNGYVWLQYDNSSEMVYVTPLSVVANAPAFDQFPTVGYVEIESGCQGSTTAPFCFNPITDSATNPYLYGVLGNMRPSRSYAYYGDRNGPLQGNVTHIRKDGIIPSFKPFWKFQGAGIIPQHDETRWVWNAETTLFNKYGLELENKDPLGRFNSGLYGYNQTLPVAVTQNSRYREAAFEGFEDYRFTGGPCVNSCPVGRHFDFSEYAGSLDSTQSHTGTYSLRIPGNSNIAIAAAVLPEEDYSVTLNYNTKLVTCTNDLVLEGITTDQKTILPAFSPRANTQVVVSAWVKEEQNCSCSSYVSNQLQVAVKRPSGDIVTAAVPTGNIIEGWQRYEQVVSIPADATNIVLSFLANAATTVYVDDIRVHPYHANMKSFVYHPGNLRLMAELDENNYASFYEYDDDGTLIRVKKETERGIKTIKETRSALRIEE